MQIWIRSGLTSAAVCALGELLLNLLILTCRYIAVGGRWRAENGIGLRLVSLRRRTNASNQLITAAYVSAIVPGSAADRLHGELSEGRPSNY